MHRSIVASLLFVSLAALSACGQTARVAVQPTQNPIPGDSIQNGGRQLPYIPPWNFMSLSTAGVDTFLLEHPTCDGRGVVILIFDTGVDMSIPGLLHTSTGGPKVIDALDFSLSNIIRFRPARLQGQGAAMTATGDGLPVRLRGVGELNPPPADKDLYIGMMDEAIYRNSSVRDFDGDGESASKFGAILYRAADGWRVVIDTDADSSLTGEKPVGSYRERFETIQFKQRSAETNSPLTFAASINADAKTVAFHYDMGGHGTHVAGIAAGNGINNEPGFNGMAPGAEIISGKFAGDTADDNTVTGSMKRAYEYAGALSDSLQRFHKPVVVNMSFGIGAALEGRADIEQFLDTLLPAHPNLYVVTSAGNEGPGLSSVGIPASASRMITVGAVLPKGIGRDGYKAALDRDIIWDFSSRGGEVDKPDVMAPGTAVSTIPRYAFESRESGTSMASPYTTGVVAVLLSAMRQEDSTWMPTQELMRRALRYSGHLMPDYAPIEQGGGLINVRRAYSLLRDYKRSGFAGDLQLYKISTTSPNYPDGRGTTAFWRSAYVPGDDWRQTFTISRYIPRVNADQTDDFFRAYNLESTAPWLHTVQSNVYIRNRDNAQVDVIYDRDKMAEPGLYSASIIGRRASARGPAAGEEREFELINTVIVPYLFSPEKSYTVTTPTQKLPAGVTRHFFFAPPAGAAAITFTLSVPKGSRSNVSGKVADRLGVTSNYLPRVKGTERSEGSNTIAIGALGDGVIDVVVQADAFEGSGDVSEFTLTASAVMFSLKPVVENYGDTRQLKVDVRNTGNEPLRGDFTYTIKGYGRTIRDTIHGSGFSRPFVMRKGDGALWLSPRFSDEDYMHATDILIRIVDASGAVQAQEALNTPSTWLFLPNFNKDEDSAIYRMEVVFGAANYTHPLTIPFEIEENHMRPSDPRSLGGYSSPDLMPFIPATYAARLPSISDIPKGYGYHALGEIDFKPRGSEQPITFDFPIP
ncbi:MAG: peptidase and in kexin sedolisin [Chlorobi bacterium]|nr:peptidase and in kexin sedolisin [Chlorobiota bacterium]